MNSGPIEVIEVVEAGGLEIAFRRRGEGPALLLLHGAVSDSRVWRVQLVSLADAFTVVAWDAPGCGASSDPPEHFRMPDVAEVLGAFIDALELDRAHVLGHSWGSTLVLAGDADQRSPLAVAGALHAEIPGSTLTVLAGLGHECYLEDAARFDAAVRSFLLGLPG